MQIATTAVQLIGRRRRRLTRRLPPPPESLAPARLGSGAVAPSPLLALTGGSNSLFIREESTLKHESIFLSLLRESYTPVGKFFRPPRWMMSRFSIPTGEALIVVHPCSSLCVHWLCVSSHMYSPLFVTFRYIHVVCVCDDM